MNDSKKWWQSKTEITLIVGFLALLPTILQTIGVVDIGVGSAINEQKETIVDQILAIVTGVSFIVGFITRFMAKKQLKK